MPYCFRHQTSVESLFTIFAIALSARIISYKLGAHTGVGINLLTVGANGRSWQWLTQYAKERLFHQDVKHVTSRHAVAAVVLHDVAV